MSTYEFWLTDDEGTRIALLRDFYYASYTRVVSGFGTIEIGIGYDEYIRQVVPWWKVDRRVEVWRSPSDDIPMRLERVFFLRKGRLYVREDNEIIIVMYGRDATDLLARRYIIQNAGTAPADKTDYVDDMMKDIVRQQMLDGSALDYDGTSYDNERAYPAAYFTVELDRSEGPSVTKAFADRQVLTVLQELQDFSFETHAQDPTEAKIYFDVIEVMSGNGKFGFQFRTYANLRGHDRTGKLLFSVENGNLNSPSVSIDHYDEINWVYGKGPGRGESVIVDSEHTIERGTGISVWNRREKVVQFSSETTQIGVANAARREVYANQAKKEFFGTFLNTPGSDTMPRSLYGVDWDLGDMIRARVGKEEFDVEITIIYVVIHEDGSEEVYGRNKISEE